MDIDCKKIKTRVLPRVALSGEIIGTQRNKKKMRRW